MADVFISYARSDRDIVAKLAAALEAEGFSVWWDRHIAGGGEYSKDIETALKEARAVIVAWSAAAAQSHWVRDEAVFARDRGRLVPIRLDSEEAPLGFRQVQAIEFAGWTGSTAGGPYAELLRSLRLRLSSGASGAEPAPSASAAAPFDRESAWRNPKLLAAGGVAALVLAVAIGALLWRGDGQRRADAESAVAPAPTESAAAEKSIAVLPFADMSEAKDQEYFSDGVAEEILNALAKIDGLHVAGRTSSFSFKGRDEDLKTIGATLGVAHVLEGSVRKQGERVRITAQLIRADNGFHLWSETYDGDLTDIFDLQERIARSIAGELQLRLGGGADRLVAEATADSEAYRLYLEGRTLFNKRVGDSLPRAIELFEAAIGRDPRFAKAWSGLAAAWGVSENWWTVDVAASRDRALEAARKAIALDPALAEPYAVIGLVERNRANFAAAREAHAKAAALDPNDVPTLLWSSIGEYFLGRHSLAIRRIGRLLVIDPVSVNGPIWASNFALALGDLDRAEDYANRAPTISFLNRAELAAARGERALAPALATRAYTEGTSLVSRVFDAKEIEALFRGAFGGAAERQAALALIDAHVEAGEERDGLAVYALVLMGEPERAFAYFDGGQVRISWFLWRAVWGPFGKTTRQHPAFQEFAQRHGLVAEWKRDGWPDLCRPAPAKGPDAFECD